MNLYWTSFLWYFMKKKKEKRKKEKVFLILFFSLHPSLPLVATSSGRRHFPDMYDSSDSDIENSDNDNVVDNSLKLWWV